MGDTRFMKAAPASRPHRLVRCFMGRLVGRLCAPLAVIGLAACAAPDRVSVSGSTTLLPVVSKAAESYGLDTDMLIIVNAGGSGAGFNQLAEGQTDIGMMSRDITQGELDAFSDIDFSVISIGKDAVVPVISSEVYDAGVTALSLPQIAAIYRGEIDNWAEFGGPDLPILAIDKEASSGTRHTFMALVLGDKNAEAPGADLVLGSNNEEQTAITQSDAAIGMLSHAWINDDVKGVSVILGNGEIVTPSLTNIRNGKFPITRDLNLVVRDDIRPDAQAFIDYILSPKGQDHVKASGYVRLTQ